MARKFSIPTSFLLVGGVVIAGAFLLSQNPNIINQILHPAPTAPAVPTAPSPSVATVISAPEPANSVVQPPLAQMEAGVITPYFQNTFCDSTLGYNWNPLTGKCERHIQGSSGRCAQGSHFDRCQCQCVPNGIVQPICNRDCTTSCRDKINQVWSWCQVGCIPKSAAYGNPGLLACPPI